MHIETDVTFATVSQNSHFGDTNSYDNQDESNVASYNGTSQTCAWVLLDTLDVEAMFCSPPLKSTTENRECVVEGGFFPHVLIYLE